ncbi:hypothetical protein ACLI4Q_05230 [Natrialbaceae archaeon A-CW1-1]
MNRLVVAALIAAIAAIGLGLASIAGIEVVFVTRYEGVALALFALSTCLVGALRWKARLETPPTHHRPPAVERSQPLPAPGDELDGDLELAIGIGHRDRDRHRRAVSDRLEWLVIATLCRTYGWSKTDGRRALERGTWTDDPVASAFFTGERGWRYRLAMAVEHRRFVLIEPDLRLEASHVIEALATIDDVEAETP